MNQYVREIHLALEQMGVERVEIHSLHQIVGAIVTSTVDLYGPNHTIGREVRAICEAYELVRNEIYQSQGTINSLPAK